MEKNIYDLMNEAPIQLEAYESMEMSELEQKRVFKRVVARRKQKSMAYKKYGVVASVAILCLSTLGAIPAMATVNPIAYKIASLLGLERKLDEYTTVVNTSVLDKGVSVGIGEVLYDQEGDVLIVTNYVSVVEAVERQNQETYSSVRQKLYINGQELNISSATQISQVDEHVFTVVTTYNMPTDLVNKSDVTLKIRRLTLNGIEYPGRWDFSFSMDGTLFRADTKIVNINKTLKGMNNDITITKYVETPLEEGIYYMKEGNELIQLRGKDNKGNEIVFVPKGGIYDRLFKLILAPGYTIKEDATSLTLELYEKPEILIGELEGQARQVSEKFEATGSSVTLMLP